MSMPVALGSMSRSRVSAAEFSRPRLGLSVNRWPKFTPLFGSTALNVAPPSTWAVNFTPLAQLAGGAAGAPGAVAAADVVSPTEGFGALVSGAVCAEATPANNDAQAAPASRMDWRVFI